MPNPYIFPSSCAVCGGDGMATIYSAWGGRHVDPRVCASVLDRRRRELEKREAALASGADRPEQPSSDTLGGQPPSEPKENP